MYESFVICLAFAETRHRHSENGFADEACGFFDLFASPAPELEELAVAAVQAGIDSGRLTERIAREYGRLFQAYELMFWNTLAD